jgi:hypothetical protein
MAKEPNHVCKNPNCQSPSYYACDDCDKNRGLHWRSLCCSVDCFKEYMRIIDERDNPKVQETVTEQDVEVTQETPRKLIKK